jgi:hypothetical protein
MTFVISTIDGDRLYGNLLTQIQVGMGHITVFLVKMGFIRGK